MSLTTVHQFCPTPSSSIARGLAADHPRWQSGEGGKNGAITEKWGNKGDEASHDFWGWHNCSPLTLHRVLITHAKLLIPRNFGENIQQSIYKNTEQQMSGNRHY